MVPLPLLAAECTTSAPCDLPNGLPWYFGAVIAALWLAVVVGIVVVGRRYLLQRASRRRQDDADGRRAIEPSTPGTDVERW